MCRVTQKGVYGTYLDGESPDQLCTLSIPSVFVTITESLVVVECIDGD